MRKKLDSELSSIETLFKFIKQHNIEYFKNKDIEIKRESLKILQNENAKEMQTKQIMKQVGRK